MFDSTSQVLRPDGSYQAIGKLKTGDVVMSSAGRTATVQFAQCDPQLTAPRSMARLSLVDGRSLTATPDSVLFNGRQFEQADQLEPGDTLVVLNGTARVQSSTMGDFSGDVCGIMVDGTGWFFVNGLLAGGPQR